MRELTAEDLEFLFAVLDSVVCEVAEREIALSVYEMIARLFTAAEQGILCPRSLRSAILRGNAGNGEPTLVEGRRYGGSEARFWTRPREAA
jgi:hypothetical protein